jgi:DNA-binding CsgD family transcriptional regulator
LSNREQEIMQWVSVGKKNLEISQILNISPSTVRNHLQNVFRKLDVINRAQAVFAIQQKRVIDPERV